MNLLYFESFVDIRNHFEIGILSGRTTKPTEQLKTAFDGTECGTIARLSVK